MNHWVVHMAELRHNPDMLKIMEKKGFVGVGWTEIDNLNKFKTKEEFQRTVEETYPEETRKMSISIQAGMLYRWTHETSIL